VTVRTPAGKLVSAFGDVERMAALYAPGVEWSLLGEASPYPRPIKGREAVIAFNREVWTRHYRPDCSVEILDEVGDERASAVRFIYRAHMLAANRPYENEYTLFVRSGPDGVAEVFEGFDTARARDLVRGAAAGAS
jgi:hypothetical protein